MMKYLVILLFVFLIACNEDRIYYSYNDVTVTRIDRGNEIFLYYGKFKENDKLPTSYVRGEYSGFNDWFLAMLMFNSTKTVTVIRLDGWCEQFGKDSSISLSKYWEKLDNPSFIKWNDNIKGNYQNVIEISSTVQYEIERNKNWDHSKVTVIYPK